MHAITTSLAVGNVEDAKRPPAFIGGVLFLAQEYDIEAPRGVTFAKIPLTEFAEVSASTLQAAIQWLEEQAPDQKLLICCRAGMGRSVSVAIAYLCCVAGLPYAEALALVKARRPGATPLPHLERTIRQVLELRQPKGEQAVPKSGAPGVSGALAE